MSVEGLNKDRPLFTSHENHRSLYQAQERAYQVFKTGIFPCYSTQYVQAQKGLKGKVVKCYAGLYDLISFICSAIGSLIGKVEQIICKYTSWLTTPLLNLIYPINPINGRRHFLLLGREVEKCLGDWIVYPLVTAGMYETYTFLPNSSEPYIDKVNACLNKLKRANKELLNPSGQVEFNYRAIVTCSSNRVNAFAVPGGGMVVFAQLIQEIDAAIRSNKIPEVTIPFADGSSVKVNLQGMDTDAVLAALLGHEMTHVAARHFNTSAIIALIVHLLIGAIFYAGHIFFGLNVIPDLLIRLKEYLVSICNSLYLRKHEHEADVTGVYFAQKAGYNPLGALYLSAVIADKNQIRKWIYRHFGFMFTHPCSEDRQRAIFAAIAQIAPEQLKGRLTWNIAKKGYDFKRSAPGIKYAFNQQQRLRFSTACA